MRAALLAIVVLPLAACGPVAGSQAQMVQHLQIQKAMGDYETARRGGNALDMCVKAKLVAIAYEDAKDTADASVWRSRETEDCRLAMSGMNLPVPPGKGF
jgi:hypothetical protein